MEALYGLYYMNKGDIAPALVSKGQTWLSQIWERRGGDKENRANSSWSLDLFAILDQVGIAYEQEVIYDIFQIDCRIPGFSQIDFQSLIQKVRGGMGGRERRERGRGVRVISRESLRPEEDLFIEINGVVHFTGHSESNKNMKCVAKSKTLSAQGLRVFSLEHQTLSGISKQKGYNNRVIMLLELLQQQ